MKKVIYILVISIISLSNAFSQSRVLDTNAEVGSLPGGIAVSPAGAATYNIPLAIPEGRAGMTPSISINYNSQSGNGLLGVGWSIGGLSTISRGGSTIYHDGQVEGIKFTSDDSFFLDGQRLILISSDTWQDEYKTEIESFSKIIAYHNEDNNPQKFKVWTKDGRIIEYGFTNNSNIEPIDKTVPYQWKINNIEDRLGNYIQFIYDETGGKGMIKQINYAGNKRTGAPTDYVVEFVYNEARIDPMKMYIAGGSIEINLLLENVIVKYENQVLRTYELNYSQAFYSHIESIELFSGDKNAPYLNELVFEWGDYIHDKQQVNINYNNPNTDKYFIDFNNDGLTDMIEVYWEEGEVVPKVFTNWNYRLNTSNGFSEKLFFNSSIDPYFIGIFIGDYDGDGFNDFLKAKYLNENMDQIHIDRIFYGSEDGFYEVGLRAGSIVSNQTKNNDDEYTLRPEYEIADFNGDGISDFLVGEKYNSPYNNVKVYNFIKYPELYELPSKVVFTNTVDFGNTNNFGNDCIYIGDFDGDGKSDLMKTAEYGGDPHTSNCFIYKLDFENNQLVWLWNSVSNGYPTTWHRIFVKDFNGDNIDDILTYNYTDENPHWEISCFNGKDNWESFPTPFIPPFDPLDPSLFDTHRIIITDFDGDETSDIMYILHAYNTELMSDYAIYYSNGDNLSSEIVSGEIKTYGGLSLINMNTELKEYYYSHNNLNNYVDLNGDGKSDLYINGNNADDIIYNFDINFTANSIKSVTNGFGSKTSISYKPLTDNNIYTKGSGSLYPLTDIQAAIYVVDRISPDEDLGTGLETTYHYSGARIHKLGKGFLGFQQVTVTSNSTNTITETNYGLLKETIENKELYLMPFPAIVNQYSMNNGVLDKMLSETFVEMELIRTQSNDLIYLPVTTSSISHTWDNDTERTFIKTTKMEQPINEIDEYGNSLKSYAGADNQLFDADVPATDYKYHTTRESFYENNRDLVYWLISRPDWTMITKHDVDNSLTDHKTITEFDYYNQISDAGFSLLEIVTTKPMTNILGENDYYNSFTKVNEYEYDYYGHLIKETTSAPLADTPLDPIITEYKYDVFDEYHSGYGHRFLTRIITPSPGDDYVEQFVYDVVTGLVEKEISPNGLITEYDYGSFERLKTTTYPDGTFFENNMIWTGQSNGQLYYSEEKNNSGATAKTYYDKFGRELKKTVPHYWQQKHSFTEYDDKGRIERVSTPWIKQDGELQWTYFEYDNLGRVINTTLPSGNILFTEYKGATVYATNTYTGIRTHEKVDALGRPIEVKDPTGFVKYYYFSDGNLKEVEAGGISTTMKYDPIGNQIELDEPNAGVNTYVYDAFGMLTDQTDGKGNHYKMEYDILGRITKRSLESGGNETTNYEYNDINEDDGFGKLQSTDLNGIVYTYDYDYLGRTASETQSFQGNNYRSVFTYDENGNIDTYTYPGGLELGYEYLSDGSLDLVKDIKTNEILWRVISLSIEGGQIGSTTLGNGLSTFKQYDNFGFLTEITTGSIQDLEYNWNPNTGNLNWRMDNIFGLKESFTYDMLLQARLESWEVIGLEKYEANYNHNGNISKKSDVVFMGEGWMTYYQTPAGPHALTSISYPKDDYLSHAEKQSIEYTPFNKTLRIDQFKIDEGSKIGGYDYVYGLEYGPDRARKISVLYKDYQLSKMKHFVGNYEVEIDADGNTRELNYISGGDGLFAIYVNNMGADTMYYVHKDHLGSPYCVTGEDGEIIVLNGREAQIYSFGPWGRKRNPFDWSFEGIPSSNLFDRGFTGHEHLDVFGLINMNGRTYDPWLGRMMQPDNYVQAAGYLQNYNRYSYALNNPLRYTDPDGEFVVTAFLVGVVIYSALDYGIQVGMNYAHGYKGKDAWVNKVDFFDVALSGVIGGVTMGYGAALTAGSTVGKFGMFMASNSKWLRVGEIALTSSIDITGEGWQPVTGQQFGQRIATSAVSWGLTEVFKSSFNKVLNVEPKVDNSINSALTVTTDGVVLPKGALIPDDLIENPYRKGSYGIFENEKFVEKIRIDPKTLPGFKGPNNSHFHIDGGKEHIFDLSKWPWWK